MLRRLRVKPAMTVYGLFLVTISCLLVSCEKEIEFNGEQSDPRLVINSLVGPGQRVEACVSKSYFFLDTSDTSTPEDVVVSLYVNDNLVGEMTPFVDTVWEYYGMDDYRLITSFYNDYCPQEGDVVKIKASANGFEDAEGETSPLPNAVDFQYDMEVLEWHADHYFPYFSESGVPEGDSVLHIDGSLELSIKITDPNPGKLDYFRLIQDKRQRNDKGDNWYYISFDYDDPIFGVGVTENDIIDVSDLDTRPEGVFTDVLFDGTSYRIKLKIGFDINIEDDVDLDVIRVPFLVEHLTREYYLYLNTCDQGDMALQIWAEPIQTYSNVTHGYGIVAGWAVDTLWMPLPLTQPE